MRFLSKPIIKMVTSHLVDYPTPISLNYLWGFGSMAGIILIIQLITGIFLAMHYTPYINIAFQSIEHIMRDVNIGWLLRYIHANGASFMFFVLYVHIFRGFYYGSYTSPRVITWCIGVIIFILMMATAFLGYILCWGQMSFWAATVITNLFSAFPLIGKPIVYWLWGGFCVDNPTLNRFFSLHYLLPFIISALVILHLAALHEISSNNIIGCSSLLDKATFYPYFWMKDLVGWICLIICFTIFVFFYPNYLGHSDNYIGANALITPIHIVPEWYFLPFYAILRSISNKLFGVIAMFGAILVWLIIPHHISLNNIRSTYFKRLTKILFFIFLMNWFLLGWLGGCNPESPYIEIGGICTSLYFGIIGTITK